MSSDSVVLSGEIDLLAQDTAVGAVDWFVGETRQGWTGFATFNPAPGLTLDSAEIFARASNQGVIPGVPIRFGLWGRAPYSDISTERGSDVRFIRSWPSVITSVYASVALVEGANDRGAMALFSDPVTYWLNTPVWGVFKELSPGELLAGGLMLAAGASGEPTLEPAIPGMPSIHITQSLSDDVERIPYAIAAGETLGAWLGAVFGRLGIRMEMLGDEDSALHITLSTGEPAGAPVDMTLEGSVASAKNAVISELKVRSSTLKRSVLLDNPSIGEARRIGSSPTVSRLYTAAELTLDQVTKRTSRSGERPELRKNVITVVTRQPGLHPGRIVSFDQPISGAGQWQVNEVSHGADDGQYRNQVELMKLGIWTPLSLPDQDIVTLGGVVHDPQVNQDGKKVERDNLGRISVRLCCGQNVPVSAQESPNGSNDESGESDVMEPEPIAELPVLPPELTVPPPELMLTVIQPMAGGEHGFVPAHRHGDMCQIIVHNPMAAEVIGFGFADHRRVDKRFLDVSMGVLADFNAEQWSGIIFRPGKAVAEEEEEEEKKWRRGET